jgi:hypothetical protein
MERKMQARNKARSRQELPETIKNDLQPLQTSTGGIVTFNVELLCFSLLSFVPLFGPCFHF